MSAGGTAQRATNIGHAKSHRSEICERAPEWGLSDRMVSPDMSCESLLHASHNETDEESVDNAVNVDFPLSGCMEPNEHEHHVVDDEFQ